MKLRLQSLHRKNRLSIPPDWNSEVVRNARTDYVQSFALVFHRPICWIDESGFNLHTRRSKGRSLKGEPAIISLLPRGQRVTLLAAFTKANGIVHAKLIHQVGKRKGTNAEDFRNFLLDLFPKIPRDGSVIILDNCKIHHADAVDVVWQMEKVAYDIDKLFLSPYSPFLNPIELAFNVLKNLIRTAHFTNTSELIEVIKDKLSEITPIMATKFADNTSKYFILTNVCLDSHFKEYLYNPIFQNQLLNHHQHLFLFLSLLLHPQ